MQHDPKASQTVRTTTSTGFPEVGLVDRRQAALVLGVSPGTVDNLRIRGELPSLKIGARRLYDPADLRRFIESRKADC